MPATEGGPRTLHSFTNCLKLFETICKDGHIKYCTTNSTRTNSIDIRHIIFNLSNTTAISESIDSKRIYFSNTNTTSQPSVSAVTITLPSTSSVNNVPPNISALLPEAPILDPEISVE